MTLRVADAQMKASLDDGTFAAWGQRLNLGQFRAREAALRAHPWAREVMTTWLWEDWRGEPLCSCETFEVASHVGAAAGRSWSIASVFVEPTLRGQGHASAMLQAVAQRLGALPGAQALVLFSEVGPALYARLGFRAVEAFDVVLPPRLAPTADEATTPEVLPVVTVPGATGATLVLHPGAAEADWHLERERFYGQALGRPVLSHHGARRGAASIAWTAYWKTDELQVLWLDAVDAADQRALLAAAQHAAASVGLERVRVWETTPVTALPGMVRVRRDDEVPMFLPLSNPGAEAWADVHRVLWV